jgi:di/tricarboxylate transporter
MTTDALLVFGILAATIALFVSDRLRLDLVALLSLLALALTGILTAAEALAGFSDPVVLMIAGLFVVSGALFNTGVAAGIGRGIGKMAGTSHVRMVVLVMATGGLLSGFMSSTGTVAVMLPAVVAMAWNAGISPSRLLIPLAFGALLGGMLTLIGTPPNIVVANQLAAEGWAPFGFFDFTPVGLVMLAVGVGVMVLFGTRILPDRAPASPARTAEVALPAREMAESYRLTGQLFRLRVPVGSLLAGRSVVDADLRGRYGVGVLHVQRPQEGAPGLGRSKRRRRSPLEPGDVLEVQGARESVEALVAAERLELVGDSAGDGEEGAHYGMAEVLLTPRSRLLGRTLAEVRFRDRYGVNVLAVLRRGEPLDGDLRHLPLQFGDTLLVAGPWRRIDLLRGEGNDFVVISRTPETRRPAPAASRAPIAVAIMVAMMLLMTFEVVPVVMAVLLAAVAVVLTGCLDVEAAYRSVNWESVVLIAGILPMATAMEKSGGMELIVGQLGALAGAGPLVMLAVLFLLTSGFSQVISNTATTVLVAPIAFQMAMEMGVSPYPFLMTVAVAASTAFATPVATPVNTLVLGPGAYRFGDFFRVGMLLQVAILAATLLVVPLLFPF